MTARLGFGSTYNSDGTPCEKWGQTITREAATKLLTTKAMMYMQPLLKNAPHTNCFNMNLTHM